MYNQRGYHNHPRTEKITQHTHPIVAKKTALLGPVHAQFIFALMDFSPLLVEKDQANDIPQLADS